MTDEGLSATLLELLDWKRRVFALYAEVRAAPDPAPAWENWCAARDELFRVHPSSPLGREERGSFAGVPYFGYDPALRVAATIEPLPSEGVRIGSSGVEPIAFERFAAARFSLAGADCALELYWLTAYGGGVFVPFRDETSGRETYGGGRYLLDTVKGADLGIEGESSTSTSPTTHLAATTRAGCVRSPRPRTACLSRSGPASRCLNSEVRPVLRGERQLLELERARR
jgi:hypothetical protein